MRKLMLIALSLPCALALSACAPSGAVRPPITCPRLQPVPASLMQPPTTEQRVRAELFEPPPTPTHKSEDSKPS